MLSTKIVGDRLPATMSMLEPNRKDKAQPATTEHATETLLGPYPAQRQRTPSARSLDSTEPQHAGSRHRAHSEPPGFESRHGDGSASTSPPNPFAMPPLDTEGRDFETSIARLSMLERGVVNQQSKHPPTLPKRNRQQTTAVHGKYDLSVVGVYVCTRA